MAIIAAIVAGSLTAGAVTAGVVVAVSGQKKHWWLTIPFAVLWFAVGWVLHSVFYLL